MRGSWVKASVACGLVACGGVAWLAVHYVLHARDPGTAGTVAQGLAAVLVPVAGLAVWLVRRFQLDVPTIDLRRAYDIDLCAEHGGAGPGGDSRQPSDSRCQGRPVHGAVRGITEVRLVR